MMVTFLALFCTLTVVSVGADSEMGDINPVFKSEQIYTMSNTRSEQQSDGNATSLGLTNRGHTAKLSEDGNCTLIGAFISSHGDVLTCVSRNSLPATYCTACEKDFHQWHTFYRQMVNISACGKLLIDDSSVATNPSLLGRIVNETQAYWKESRCSACLGINETDLMAFRTLDAELGDCLHGDSSCEECLHLYENMSKKYKLLYKDDGCVELKDRHNRTQHSWNKKGCKPFSPDITTAMILSGFFALLPAVFYTYLRIFGARRTRKLLRAGATQSAPPSAPTAQNQPLLASEGQAAASASART